MDRLEFCQKLLRIVRTLALITAVGFLWGTRFTDPLPSELSEISNEAALSEINIKTDLKNSNPELFKAFEAGEILFKSNCAACHKIEKEVIGPKLKGVSNKYEKEWLYAWIRNSQKLIKSGDDRANALYNEYNQSVMTAFPTLTDEDIEHILTYIELN